MILRLQLTLTFSLLIGLFGFSSFDETKAACPTIVVSGTNVSCYGNSNGTAQVAISNGSGNYTISWSNGSNLSMINFLPVGTYTVSVKDNVSGCSVVGAYVVGSPDPIAVTETITNVNCNGTSTGAINISVVGGNGSYVYTWKNSSNVTISSSQNLTGAIAGTYSLRIVDSKGCVFTKLYTITQPAQALNSSAVLKEASCFSSATGEINIEVWGGTPSYTYLWSNGASTQDVTGLTSGGYSVTITDFKGCQRIVPFTINQPSVLTGNLTASSVLCYGDATGSLTVVPTGGTTPYTYAWRNTTTLYAANTPTLSNVIADDYQVTVTDARGCVYNDFATVNQPSELMLSNTYVNVSCYGDSDGSIDLTVLGGSPTYGYVWKNSAGVTVGTGQDLVGIPAEMYDVLVTDFNGCTKTLIQEITQPPLPISVAETVTHVKCFGENTGEIELAVSGGTSPYVYNWTTGQSTSTITGLIAQTYIYTIVDSKLCQYSNSVIVSQPAQPLTVSNVITDANCFGDSNGGIDLTVTGGTAPYTYEWENSSYVLSNSNQDLVNYPSDTYTYRILDSNNCFETGTLFIDQPPKLESTIVGVDILCKYGNTGEIDLTVTGGVLPYGYTWNNGPISEDQNGLIAGYYEVEILDAHNCLLIDSITLTEPLDSLSYSYSVFDVRCNNGDDGTIDLVVAGGTAPYNYTWSNGASSANIIDLTSGYYEFEVVDDHNCVMIDSIFVDQPDALALNEVVTPVRCYGLSDGIIDVTTTGGTPPFVYSWYNSDFALSTQTEDLVDFPADLYQVEILDSNNCFYELFIDLPQPDSLVISHTFNNVSCKDSSDANIFITITGGNPGYFTNWSNGSTVEDQTNIVANDYELIVLDQKNCTDTFNITITEPDYITMTYDVNPVTCIDQHNGEAFAYPVGGNGGYNYEWSNGDLTYNASGLYGGTAELIVTDILGCLGYGSVDIPVIEIGCIDPVNAFSPNGDAYNDTWVIDNMELYPNIEVNIYNRWGNLIKKYNNIYDPWNGQINGADAPSGTYFYVINLNLEEVDREGVRGNVTIVR